MKTLPIALLISGFSAVTGYYIGAYTAPSADLYHAFKKQGYTSQEIKSLPRNVDDLIDFMSQDSRRLATVSLAAYRFLSEDDTESAIDLLSRQVANFYVTYSPEFNPGVKNSKSMSQIIQHIDDSAVKYPHLRTAIDSIEWPWRTHGSTDQPEKRSESIDSSD